MRSVESLAATKQVSLMLPSGFSSTLPRKIQPPGLAVAASSRRLKEYTKSGRNQRLTFMAAGPLAADCQTLLISVKPHALPQHESVRPPIGRNSVAPGQRRGRLQGRIQLQQPVVELRHGPGSWPGCGQKPGRARSGLRAGCSETRAARRPPGGPRRGSRPAPAAASQQPKSLAKEASPTSQKRGHANRERMYLCSNATAKVIVLSVGFRLSVCWLL